MNIAAPSENVLVTIPQDTALSVFTTDKAIDPFLARIREELDAFVPDITTAAGRKAIASMAYKVAQSKTYLEGVGKDLAAEAKEIPKKIDACRKHVRDTLDEWRDEVRKPLTDWEAAEEARVKSHTDILEILNELSRSAPGRPSADLKMSIAYVEGIVIGPACEEFEAEYARAKDAARSSLVEELTRAEIREAEALELAQLRRKNAEREAADREEAIRKEAAAEATRKAEAEAQRKIDAEAEAKRKAEAETEAANRRAAETEARLKKEAEDKAAAEKAEAERREANKRHCGAINRKAVAAFVAGGMTEKAATQAVTLIAQKKIPNVTISY